MLQSGFPVRVDRIVSETRRIKSYRLRPLGGEGLPGFAAGAHIDVVAPNGIVRQYSLSNPPGDRPGHYEIAVLREDAGRGGSASMHDDVSVGDEIIISPPRNHFPLRNGADRYLLLAGGIGITPLLSMAWRLHEQRRDFELHHCAPTFDDVAFRERLLTAQFAAHVHLHLSREAQSGRLDLTTMLAAPQPRTQIYCCGPERFTDAVIGAAAAWPQGQVFLERFKAVAPRSMREANSFTIEISSTGQRLAVPADKSILQVLRANGIERDSLCEDGLCGSCETGLLSGEADHRDSIQTEAEKRENTAIMVCCSRAISPVLKLDL